MKKIVFWLAHIICSFSAINWGFLIFFRYNAIDKILHFFHLLAFYKIVYGTIAAAGVVSLFCLLKK